MQLSRVLRAIDRAIPFRLRMAGATLSSRILCSIGAFAGILAAAIITYACTNAVGSSFMLIAPVGASAVLAFVVPSSPLAQPWSVVGGNCVSALLGALAAYMVPSIGIASALAVATAILAMTLTRSLHPPGGACALVMVLAFHENSGQVAGLLASLLINSVVLVIVAWVFHRIAGRTYPHRAAEAVSVARSEDLLHPDDLRAALADLGEAFDVTSGDLDAIFRRAQAHREERLRQARFWKRAA